MSAQNLLEEFKNQSGHIVEALKKEMNGIRTNRPATALVEDLKVDYYGQFLPLKQLGTVGITPPREIHIQVWDKGVVGSVVKAIETSSLGLTANTEGNVIRIYLPELSLERREELKKHVKRVAEDRRIKIRHLRDEINKKVQKAFDDSELNEDQKFKLKEEIQKQTDKVNQDIEKVIEAKTKEIDL
ncbi:MAG: ribosome recycling factor [Patescibacteria group bacterium]|nr:ribosome recycling factor [Patescibacteria group bacterium]